MGDLAGHFILIFDSIHHVLAAERAFLQRGVWHDLVPTPRDVHSDCGMVIKFREADLGTASDMIIGLDPKPRQAYRMSEYGYQPVDLSQWRR